MYTKRVPDHLSVIVVSAKGLKPKKEGKGKYSVVFGIGSSKANSEPTESRDGCPVFNCETEFVVPGIGSVLTLKVVETQHDEILGQVLIPIFDIISLSREHVKTYPLQPHRKKKQVTGDLTIITWVTKWRMMKEEDVISDDGAKKSGPFSKLKGFLSNDKQKQELSVVSNNLGSNFLLKKKAFSSCNDLSIFGKSSSGGGLSVNTSIWNSGSQSCGVSRKPEVSGISPSDGPVCGGTRLVVRGNNLGEKREDVVGLFVCGSNVLASLEYVSSSKLICTTKPWKHGAGNISVETQSGGKGISLIQFTFLPSNGDEVGAKKSDGADDSGISVDGGSLKKVKDHDAKITEDSPRNTLTRVFGLPQQAKRCESFEGKTRPEIQSINPKEAPYNTRTKLTIKGSNLAISRLDILKIVVCGSDCTEHLEFESSSKLVCYVGPVSNPVTGNIVIETGSGGTFSSSTEFKFFPDKKELERTLLRDKHSNSANSIPKIGLLETIRRQHFTSVSSAGDPAPCSPLEPGSRSTFPMAMRPPVLEVMPMKSKKKEDRVAVLERKLIDSGKEIEELSDKNKKLQEECERLRDYMGVIVSRALTTCPQILSSDMPVPIKISAKGS